MRQDKHHATWRTDVGRSGDRFVLFAYNAWWRGLNINKCHEYCWAVHWCVTSTSLTPRLINIERWWSLGLWLVDEWLTYVSLDMISVPVGLVFKTGMFCGHIVPLLSYVFNSRRENLGGQWNLQGWGRDEESSPIIELYKSNAFWWPKSFPNLGSVWFGTKEECPFNCSVWGAYWISSGLASPQAWAVFPLLFSGVWSEIIVSMFVVFVR